MYPGGPLYGAARGLWHLITRLGEAQILLPAMLAALLWLLLVARAARVARWWLFSTAVAALLTTATKVAFFGYEVGYAPWDYTGISGHAMFAAAVLPVLTTLLAGGSAPRWRALGVVCGYGLALLIAYSRILVNAHSVSESLTGLALGSLASALTLTRLPLPNQRPHVWLGAGLALWMLVLPFGAPPSPTHNWVIKLSMAVSERAAPYQRWQMHRDYQRDLKRRQAAPASSQTTGSAHWWNERARGRGVSAEWARGAITAEIGSASSRFLGGL